MLRTLIFVPLLALTQCQQDETVAAYGASDQTWRLQQLDGSDFPAGATLTFPDPGQIAGRGPCNDFQGTLDAPYPWFEVTDLWVNPTTCPELEAEGTFFAALLTMTQSEVSGGVLVLRNEAGQEMLFTAAE